MTRETKLIMIHFKVRFMFCFCLHIRQEHHRDGEDEEQKNKMRKVEKERADRKEVLPPYTSLNSTAPIQIIDL